MGRKLLIVLLILLLAFIWGHSCMPVAASQAESSRVLDLLAPLLGPILGPENVTMHLVRKMAHFAEFCCLGLLLAPLPPLTLRGRLLAGNLALLTALVDETIQIFSGRGPAIADVWLDFAGAAAGIVLCSLLLLLRRKLRTKSPPP